MAGTNTDTTIGGWRLSHYSRLSNALAVTAGVAGVLLIAFRVQAIYFWTMLLGLFVLLALRIVHHRGTMVHLVTVGWLVGVPLGFVFAVVELLTFRDALYLLDLLRLPIIVSLFGILVATATGYARTRRVTAKHLFFSDHQAPKRK